MNAIYNLQTDMARFGNYPPEYIEKMLHPVPVAPVRDRGLYLGKQAKGKTVLDFGASGPMADFLQRTAKEYYGTDIERNPAIKNFFQLDLDSITSDDLPNIQNLNLIIAGEVIEHLSNAGHFLDLLHSYNVPVILTTPNAYSIAGQSHYKQGVENVNKEHVAWYSYKTLKTLIERHNFNLIEWFWYNGKPLIAEGLIFYMEPI